MPISLDALRDLGKRSGFALDEATLPPLAGYLELLMQWNKVMNLVGTRHWQDTFSTLVVDSLHLGRFLAEMDTGEQPECWDLGSGAGLPGLPLRMIWQKGSYWMVEAREKRALFLSTVLARHPLPGTQVFRGRAEAFMSGPPPRTADLVVSRAFMPWPDVLALVRDSLRPQGQVILLLRERLHEAPAWVSTAETWSIRAEQAYTVGTTTRYLFALARR